MKRLSRVQVISFDGDMTLWDFDKVMRHTLGCALAALRRRLPGNATAQHLEAIRLQAFRRTLEAIAAPDDDHAAELNVLYLQHRFERVELYPDALPALEQLGRSYRLGLISNGNGYPSLHGLAERFSFLVFSQDVGVEKPDPRIFLHACEQAGCCPEQLMHVGDSLVADVAGANAAGAVSVWLNRDHAACAADVVPDCEVASLDEVGAYARARI